MVGFRERFIYANNGLEDKRKNGSIPMNAIWLFNLFFPRTLRGVPALGIQKRTTRRVFMLHTRKGVFSASIHITARYNSLFLKRKRGSRIGDSEIRHIHQGFCSTFEPSSKTAQASPIEPRTALGYL